jgi:hypothetical protein
MIPTDAAAATANALPVVPDSTASSGEKTLDDTTHSPPHAATTLSSEEITTGDVVGNTSSAKLDGVVANTLSTGQKRTRDDMMASNSASDNMKMTTTAAVPDSTKELSQEDWEILLEDKSILMDQDNWPSWLKPAVEFLLSVSDEQIWQYAIIQYVRLEAALGFPTTAGVVCSLGIVLTGMTNWIWQRLDCVSRPDAVAAWFKSG